MTLRGLIIALVPLALARAQVPLVDHHQHLSSPANTAASHAPASRRLPGSAKELVSYLDAAGIRRAVVLSVAYQWGSPTRHVENE